MNVSLLGLLPSISVSLECLAAFPRVVFLIAVILVLDPLNMFSTLFDQRKADILKRKIKCYEKLHVLLFFLPVNHFHYMGVTECLLKRNTLLPTLHLEVRKGMSSCFVLVHSTAEHVDL